MASSIHESLSPQAHCPFSHLLLCVLKPLPGLMVIPYQYKLFPVQAPGTPVPIASFYLISPILTACSSLHSLSSHPQSVSSLCHPLCPNSLSQPHTLFPRSRWPRLSTPTLILSSSSSHLFSMETHTHTPRLHYITYLE